MICLCHSTQAGCGASYKQLHAHVWRQVLAKITECNIRNYSIYLYGNMLFSHFEDVGDDYEADMAKMAEDKVTQAWWSVCKPLQNPVPEAKPGEWWHDIEKVFHLD
ncbi:MAG: L-rhamnose mutarotase [Candidatus Roseilinea sp.]|uniref:L-rhamnose mutarotase n=1 Tax=Candidatus Roseilinea sp. TaxID=2838777 RepID=UPI004049F861